MVSSNSCWERTQVSQVRFVAHPEKKINLVDQILIHAARAHYDMCSIHQLTTDIKIFQDMSNLAQISCHISILEQTNKVL